MPQIIPLSRLTATDNPDEIQDSVIRSTIQDADTRSFRILQQAQWYWTAMTQFRVDRERNKRYTYGDQWSDTICVDGKRMTEEQYIRDQGNVPLKNNLIRRLVRAVVGVYRSQSKEPTCVARDRDEQQLGETMSVCLQCNMQANRMSELYARTMEEFLISGLIVHRKSYGWRNDKEDCWTDYVQPANFFIDNLSRDFRGWDTTCLGEIHDITFGQLCQQFAHTPDDYQRLHDIYALAADNNNIATRAEEFGIPHDDAANTFLYNTDPTLCRVIEVWRKEQRPRYQCHDYLNGDAYKVNPEDLRHLVTDENDRRLQQGREQGIPDNEIPLIRARYFIDDYWYYYFIAPTGEILQEGETPYRHGSHPYVIKAYPFIDGEIHSFVSDVIDQQRYTNRLITLYDWVIRSTAKGVLLIPTDCLPDGVTMDDIADRWAEVNGVIAFQPSRSGALPQQVASNCTNIGIAELLNLQLKFFEEISGVNGALQGKQGFSGTSAALYNQQTQNATTGLLDILEAFSYFVRDAAYKDVKNIQQFYDTPRRLTIAGKANDDIVYDPKRLRDVEFDLAITESTQTPAYRMLANDILMQLYQQQAIDVEQLLEHGDFPFADQLLQSIKTKKEEAAEQQQQAAAMQQQAAEAQQQNPQP